jgi:hypothetical protein
VFTAESCLIVSSIVALHHLHLLWWVTFIHQNSFHMICSISSYIREQSIFLDSIQSIDFHFIRWVSIRSHRS